MLPTAILQPTERQHIGNQIDAAMIFAWADFVRVCREYCIRLLHRLRLDLSSELISGELHDLRGINVEVTVANPSRAHPNVNQAGPNGGIIQRLRIPG
jgi:hypothetical protein